MNFTDYVHKNYNFKLNDKKINDALLGLHYCISNKIQILLAGNGGSAQTAGHFAQDLTKVGGGIAHSLSDNYGLVMAIANDSSYSNIFVEQIRNNYNDFILVCISHSGNSENVLRAALYCNNIGRPVLSFTGSNGGELSMYSDLEINVPSKNIYVVESVHSMIMHYLVDELKK